MLVRVRPFRVCPLYGTGLLPEAPGGLGHPFSHAGIDIDHKKKVDLGVLRGAGHDGACPVPPFSTVDGVSVKFKLILSF